MATNLGRSIDVNIQGKKSTTPYFFPSISSCGLKIDVKTLAETINDIDFDTVLVSCYDLHHHNEDDEFNFINDRLENLTFVDCGCYESYWLNDDEWDFEKYNQTLNKYSFDFYTSFDVYMNEDNDYNQFKKDNYESIIKSEKIAPKSIVFPVLHNTSKNQVIDLTSDLLTDDVIKVNALAYSERDLGNNILDVISNIKKIRRIVDEVDDSILIHILGCGDPKTIALYIYCGVDSFDSRDWAKRSINHHNALTYPMNYLEGLECNCDICQVSNQTYNSRLLLHNLLYYQKYMNTIRARIKEEVFDDFITELISGSLLEKINKI